jgi:hypothetical protein
MRCAPIMSSTMGSAVDIGRATGCNLTSVAADKRAKQFG